MKRAWPIKVGNPPPSPFAQVWFIRRFPMEWNKSNVCERELCYDVANDLLAAGRAVVVEVRSA